VIQHPLNLGKLRLTAPIIYTVITPQRIKLSTLQLRNLDAANDHQCVVYLYSRGQTITLTPGSDMVTIAAGETLELINLGRDINLDQGSIILATPDSNDKIEFLIDGEEDFKMER